MNIVTLIGNLTADPQKRTTQSGISTVSFTLAVQRRHKNENGQYDADFIRCVAWRQTADFIGQYGAKGRKMAIHGELQTRSYDKDGQKHTVCEVIANTAEFLDKREQVAEPAPARAQETFTEEIDPDLPF